MTEPAKIKEITGWHVFSVIAAAFSVIIMANLTLTWFAIGTFPGLDVANTYVASQQFNDRQKAQLALGWSTQLSYNNGRINLTFHGKDHGSVYPDIVSLRVGQSTNASTDQEILLTKSEGGYIADQELPKGNLAFEIKAIAKDGTTFYERRRMIIR